MLHLIPPSLHRVAYRVAYKLRKMWLRAIPVDMHGCSVIARDTQERVLLVRHSYGPPVWSFPGGGMRKGEDPQVAAMRELAEELGCAIADPQHIGTLTEIYLGRTNIAHIYTGPIHGEALPDMREIVEARFFHRHQLPHNLSYTAITRLALLDSSLEQR